MSHADASPEKTGWDELRFILKCVAPFATLVWTATLSWTLTSDLLCTTIAPIILASVAGATLFCGPSRVRNAWSAAFGVTAVVIAMVALAIACYFGVKLVIAIVGWILMFPFRHPFLFIGGIVLLMAIASGVAEEERKNERKSRRQSTEEETQSSALQTPEKKKRTRKKWSPAVRQRVWVKCEKRCFICYETLPTFRGKHMHLDHLKPFSKGGPCCESNLVAMCPACNLSKSATEYPELYES